MSVVVGVGRSRDGRREEVGVPVGEAMLAREGEVMTGVAAGDVARGEAIVVMVASLKDRKSRRPRRVVCEGLWCLLWC